MQTNPLVGNELYSLQNLMGVAFLGIWLIFSTIAAPLIIQKAIATGALAASQLLSGAFAAGRTAAATGATTLAKVGSGVTGVGGAITAGVTSAATALESLSSASLNGGYGGGSLIGSLSEMQGTAQRRRQPASTGFPKNDPTGDKTVAQMIRNTRNPYSSEG